MKTKKSGLSLILALVMVFVMASGALAEAVQYGGTYATTQTVATGNSATASENIAINVNNADGLRLQADTTTDFTTHTLAISKDGSTAGFYGMRVDGDNATFNAKGSISTVGDVGIGIYVPKVVSAASLTFSGTITTNGADAHGVYAMGDTNKVVLDGSVNVSSTGETVIYGLYAADHATIEIIGDITASGYRARGVLADFDDAHITVSEGTIIASGYSASGVYITAPLSSAHLKNVDVVVHSTGSSYERGSYGLSAGNGGSITIENGSVTVNTSGDEADHAHAYAMWVSYEGEIDLIDVSVNADMLLGSSTSGTVSVVDSELVGNVFHDGIEEGTLNINLSDSVWNGSAEASGDIGVINVDLGNSQWNVTGDSNTNGKITGDADSKVDFNGTDENITVIIDRLEGESGISVKPGDKLIIKNPAGSVESSNPDVIEVVENEDGSIEIISKGDGEADLTYQYVDENGKIKEVTVTVVSGAGNVTPTNRGGGSSNCNTGVGAALFALLGLAFIQKRK